MRVASSGLRLPECGGRRLDVKTKTAAANCAHHDRRWTLTRAPVSSLDDSALTSKRTGYTETQVVVPFRRLIPVAVCRSHVARFVVPTTAAVHALRMTPVKLPRRVCRPTKSDRTTRLERWRGASAAYGHARRGRSTIAHVVEFLPGY